MTKKQLGILILIIILALATRFLLSPAEGYTPDMGCWKQWSDSMIQHGFTNIYQKTDSNYPPLFLYTLGFVGHFYQNISRFFGQNDAILNSLLKTPAIIFDILTGLIIFFVLKKISNFKIACLSTIFYIFNPAIIYESSWWGQVDAINTLFIVLSLLCLITQKKTSWSWLFLALAIFTKLQSIIFLPLVLFITWKKDKQKPRQIVIGMTILVIVTIIILSLFIYTHKIGSFLKNIILGSVGAYPIFSANAFNVWWPVQIIKGQLIQDTNLIFGPINYRHLGLAMFACAYIFALYFLNKKSDSKSIWLAASFVALAFFMLPTEMHERYMFPVFALLSLIWIQNKKLWPIYGILSITYLLNLSFVLPPFYNHSISRVIGDASVAIVLINLGVFIYFIRLMVQQIRQSKHAN